MAVDVAIQISSYYKGFVPGIIEQMYAQSELGKWDVVFDTCMQIQGLENDQMDMLFVLSSYYLLVKGDSEKAYEYLQELRLSVERKEPRSHEFYFNVCKICSRICNLDQKYFI